VNPLFTSNFTLTANSLSVNKGLTYKHKRIIRLEVTVNRGSDSELTECGSVTDDVEHRILS